MASLRVHVSFLVFCAGFLHFVSCHILQTNQAALFVFGDSLFDPGSNNYINTNRNFLANYWPYGQTTFKNPTGRFSDGRLIPDFIAEFAWLPLIPPYLQPGNHQYTYGVNFASGGGGALVETYQGLVIDLKTQLGQFRNVEKVLRQRLGDVETEKLFSRAVYLFSVGGNDYLYPLNVNSSILQSYTKEEYVEMVIGNITTVIKEIYEVGGRKFGFSGMGPLGCLPGTLVIGPDGTGFCREEITDLVKLHNEALSKVLLELESQLKGFKYTIHDLYTSLSQRINNPAKYGFKDGKTACCGTGPYRGAYTCGGRPEATKEYQLCEDASKHLFFDTYHPTEKAYQQIAELMWSGTPNITRPYNLKTLFEQRDM